MQMPILGLYPDFASCVADQMQKGHDEESARRICGYLEKKSKGASQVAFVYQATFEPYEMQGKRFAKIRVIDLSPNENKWQVTASARARALKTLLDSPLVGPPPLGEYGNVYGGPPGSPHHGYWTPVGQFVDFESNHATYGIAEITKDYAWEKIKSQEWSAVSPSILASVEHQEGDLAVVDDFVFNHVLFVDQPAYPEAGVKQLCEGDLGSCGFYQALQAAYDQQAKSFAITDKDLSVMEKAVQSARGILTALEERLEIILYGKPEPEPTVPPLPLSSHMRNVSDVGSSPSPNQTQDPEKKTGQKMEGGNELTNTTEPTPHTLQAADAWNTADAPDKFFAVVPNEAKGPNGKKSLRKLPLASVQKKDLDEAIIRDAVSRLGQTALTGTGISESEALAKICSAAGTLNLDLPSCRKRGAGVGSGKESDNDMNDDCKELQARVKELEPLQAKVTALESENKELKAFKADVEKKERTAKIQTIVDLKTHCGLIEEKDRAQAYADLDKLSAQALDAIEAELKIVQARIDAMPSGPKAKFDAEARRNQMEDVRQAMFGYRRNEKGEIIQVS
jgi:hypothetical protein